MSVTDVVRWAAAKSQQRYDPSDIDGQQDQQLPTRDSSMLGSNGGMQYAPQYGTDSGLLGRSMFANVNAANNVLSKNGLSTFSASTSGVPSAVPVPSGGGRSSAVAWALGQQGKPYRWGATGPDAFDCSGLIQMAYRQAGISLPRTSSEMVSQLQHIPLDQLQAGDIVWHPGHVMLYIGNGQVVEAKQTGKPVMVSQLSGRNPQVGLRVPG